jgi:Cu2+-exporting ATPase
MRLARESIILVRPGASIPADGVVNDGASEVNESMITGESRPVKKTIGDRVIAGTVNGQDRSASGHPAGADGARRHHASGRTGATSRSRAQALADRAAFWLTSAGHRGGGPHVRRLAYVSR